MDFKAYLLAIPVSERAAFAARCGTTYGHLRNVAYGKSCAESLALAIERETGGAVPLEGLRPDMATALREAGYRRETPPPHSYPSPLVSRTGQGATAAPAPSAESGQTAAARLREVA